MRPSPPWDSRADTSPCRQATRNSSWVQDSDRARSASRVTDSRNVGALSALVRNTDADGSGHTFHEVTFYKAPGTTGVVVGFYKQDDIHPDGRIDTGYEYRVDADDWEDFVGSEGRHHV